MTSVLDLDLNIGDFDDIVSEYEIEEFGKFQDELESREKESLAVYSPLPHQERFHSCTAKECLLQKSNQCGGSLACFAEIARAVTGQDPHNKYPKKNGVAVVIGYGEKHIGRTVYNYLFETARFDMIRDLETGKWRAFRPWLPDVVKHGEHGDEGREDEIEASGPLIPKRFIKSIAWLKRGVKVFETVEFTTGWRLYAHNSSGPFEQAQGYEANIALFDEDTDRAGWLTEMFGRTIKRRGLIRWGGVPHSKNDDMMNLIERAEMERDKPKPGSVVVEVSIFENPYLSDEERETTMRLWQSEGEDVLMQRAYGKLPVESAKMYPDFNVKTHDAIKVLKDEELLQESDGEQVRHPIQKVLTERNGEPPSDWCRYFSFDPGHVASATLFFAVPPPEIAPSCFVAYDELHLTDCTATKWADAVEQKVGDWTFQEFIIDLHGAKLTHQATGEQPLHIYQRELAKRQVAAAINGSNFTIGMDDVKVREVKLREFLRFKDDGFPSVFVVAGRCPNLCAELRNLRKTTARVGGRDLVQDERNKRQRQDTVHCLEYAAAHGMKYVKPMTPTRDWTWDDWDKHKAEVKKEIAKQTRKVAAAFNRGMSITLGPKG